MRTAKLGVTIALLLFVGATVGMLIAQEVAQPGAEIADAGGFTPPEQGTAAGTFDGASAESAPEASETPAGQSGVVMADSDTDADVPTPETEPVETETAIDEAPCVTDAIYFHNTLRCRTCLRIEATAKATLEEEFADRLASGRLRWSSVDMQKQRQFVEQYDLVKPTLILVRSAGMGAGDWVALDDTWTLIGNPTRFSMYVADGIRTFLEGCP